MGDWYYRECTKYIYKINKLYTNPRLSIHLDKGTIDYEIADAMIQWDKIFNKHSNSWVEIRRNAYDNEWFIQPITLAMLDENIIFYNKYFKRVHFEQHIFNHLNRYALTQIMYKKMSNIFEKVYFYLYYRPFLAFIFNIDYYTIGKIRHNNYLFKQGWEYSSKDWIWGSNLKWDVPDELYKGNQNQSFYYETGQSTTKLY
jgi:hypothetical protein